MTMTGPQRLTPEAFAVEQLRGDPSLDYAAIRQRAREVDLVIQPIHYGRARKQLGLPALAARPAAPAAGAPETNAPQAATPRGDAPALSVPRSTWVPDPRFGVGVDPLENLNSRASSSGASKPVAAPTTGSAAQDDDEADEADETETNEADTDAPAAGSSPELVAPRRKGSPAFDYLLQLLRNEPNAIYADLRNRCAERGFNIAPIMYGRAKAVLGLVPVKPRGKKAAAAGTTPHKAAPLQLMQVESVAADRFAKQLENTQSLEQLMTVVRDLDAERKRLRAVLERVIDLLDEALG